MKLRTRLFIFFFALTSGGLYFLVDWLLEDLRTRYLENVEENLVDTSQLLAALLESLPDSASPLSPSMARGLRQLGHRRFEAQIYAMQKTRSDLRIYVTDSTGEVLFDSRPGGDEGRNYAKWRNIRLTLEGKYGARTTRGNPDDPLSSVLHVSAPVHKDGKLAGVVTVAKPSASINLFLAMARPKILLATAVAGAAVVLAGWLLSVWVTTPIQKLTRHAQAVRDGKPSVLGNLGRSEIRLLGQAFEEMREKLEGRRYAEEYAHHLTHELKSPLTAIQGAAELLGESSMPESVRTRFLSNILAETARMRDLVERLLQLAALENRRALENRTTLRMRELLQDVADSFCPQARKKDLAVHIEASDAVVVDGDAFLLRQSLANLLANAIDFSPAKGTILLQAQVLDPQWIALRVLDEGPGLPDYALPRVWDKFYSLPHPENARKGTGLGLPFVAQTARLHQGKTSISNRPEGGLEIGFDLPLPA